MSIVWKTDTENLDWQALVQLYEIAPLGKKCPKKLQTVFTNSRFKYFIYSDETLVGAGRALADGFDCSYICDVAIHPEFQGTGLGLELIQSLVNASKEHKKIILYANPGTEHFYKKLNFKKMSTAMAIFQDQTKALNTGLIEI